MNVSEWTFCACLNCLITGFYNWQTLIGAGVAIFAAYKATKAVRDQMEASDAAVKRQIEASEETVRRQIQASEQLEQDRYRRRSNAARSILPLALSSISNYAEAMSHYLREWTHPGEDVIQRRPTVPRDIINDLAANIEATDKENVIRMIRAMIGQIQVLESRARQLSSNSDLPNVPVYRVQCATIYAQCACLFDYARFVDDDVPERLGWNDFDTAMSALRLGTGQAFEQIKGVLESRRSRGLGPELAD